MDALALFLLGYILGTHSILLLVVKIMTRGENKQIKSNGR